MMRKEDERSPNEKHMLLILAISTTDVNFAYWPLLQFLLSPNADLKDGVCNFVVLFTYDPVLVIGIEIVWYCKDEHKKVRDISNC